MRLQTSHCLRPRLHSTQIHRRAFLGIILPRTRLRPMIYSTYSHMRSSVLSPFAPLIRIDPPDSSTPSQHSTQPQHRTIIQRILKRFPLPHHRVQEIRPIDVQSHLFVEEDLNRGLDRVVFVDQLEEMEEGAMEVVSECSAGWWVRICLVALHCVC
jgi:hypothetical protein